FANRIKLTSEPATYHINGMHKSHVTNLESQGLIEPVYFGTPKIIKLFKREDVIKLKELGYGAIK
ncbi:hypothetical protein VPJ54_19170, partial [Acinetobacter baumannii]